MKWLELKIPPVIVVALFFGVTALGKVFDIAVFRHAKQWDMFTLLPLILGCSSIALGILAFKNARTTVDPTRPENASSLVDSGVFAYTRNPMYLGMILWQISATFYVGTWLGFLSTLGCALYLNRFQIIPEERMIEQIFGEHYTAYKSRVRRWC